MHFIKSLVSLVALAGFAAAQYAEEEDYAGLSRREVSEIAHGEYLAARDEYIEKRELFRRLGGNGSCMGSGMPGNSKFCYKNGKPCGPCRSSAKIGEYCLCNK
ncbi:unnamed protein product [Clonostachys solani]|uniref:Uncharacterized protein n=1 Tax=Clonostachys solani TaxID=160281 RepID=A0A9N9W7I1_9HYPO|nr:unnamed protein product [Clonostachys solani]